MIITVTLNPAVDRTIAVKELLPGTVMRTTGVTICAGGKGINVSRAVRAAGGDTCAVFFKGGIEGALIEDLMQKDGIAVRTVPTAAASRISTQIAEDSGRFSNLNDVGGPITAAELEALIDMLDQLVGAQARFPPACRPISTHSSPSASRAGAEPSRWMQTATR